MAELWQSVGNYFRDVFILQLDWWVALGFLAQALFSARVISVGNPCGPAAFRNIDSPDSGPERHLPVPSRS